ncbi:MAG: spermidine synthase [Candidatus Dormibacteria bacterium]
MSNSEAAATGRVRGPRAPLLLVLAFTGGLTSLGLEIAASRLLAPFFGTSTYIWGVLIGLVLLYLTLGYYGGGWLADRHPSPILLYRLAAAAAGLVMLVPLVSRPILLFSQQAFNGLEVAAFLGALLAVLMVFAPSMILLGTISPFVIRLRVDRVEQAGRASGSVYAISTAGSILGAFLPAFWWIPTYGTRATIFGLGLLLLLVAMVGMVAGRYARSLMVGALCGLPLLGALFPPAYIRLPAEGRVLYESDSEYGYIQVAQVGEERQLILNEGHAVHSIYTPGQLLTGGYWDFFSAAPVFGSPEYRGRAPRRALIIGLAGGTVARQLTAVYPGIQLDGVEIDPRLIAVGRRYFDMNEPNLNAVAADGRFFLDTTRSRYDLIGLDAYRQPYIPFHLTTREFFQSCREHLADGGVLAINVGRAAHDYRLVDAITGTVRSVFPSVYQVDTPRFLNTMVYASMQPLTASQLAANIALQSSPAGTPLAGVMDEFRAAQVPVSVVPHFPVYTDDLAPVEKLVDRIIYDVVQQSR